MQPKSINGSSVVNRVSNFSCNAIRDGASDGLPCLIACRGCGALVLWRSVLGGSLQMTDDRVMEQREILLYCTAEGLYVIMRGGLRWMLKTVHEESCIIKWSV